MTSVFVECKKTDKIDFVKPLRKYIMQEFGKDQVAQYENALENLNATREDLRLNSERTDGARSKYLHYITLLKYTEKHFRIGDKGVRINFYWYDCNSKKRASQYGLDYEIACARFNVGAIESQIAFLHNRSSDEGIKQACKYYQMAAGTFAALAETTRAQGQLVGTPDLDGDYLTLLSFLMLAQAQECFYEKAERGGMKSSILYKLAAQVYDFYDKANQPIDSPSIKSSVHAFWPAFILYRMSMYKGIAHYHKGLAAFAEDKYGEQVAWLSLANSFVSDPALLKKLKAQPVSLQQQFMGRQETITNAFRSAHNDNSKIYHELVPRELPPLDMKAMVSAIAFKPPPMEPKDDPFRGLVSRVVQETAGAYKTRVNQRVQGISASVEENDRLAKGTLSSMNLPDALQALEKPQGIPDAIRARVQQLKQMNGAERLNSMITTTKNHSIDAASTLSQCDKLLQEEEELDQKMRGQYGNQWNLPASHLANSTLTQEISKYKDNLNHAKKSDLLLDAKFKKCFPILQKLSGSESDVLSLLPDGKTVSVSAETKEAANAVKRALGSLEDIIAARETLLKEILSVAESDDISADVMSGEHDSQSVMENSLEKYQEFDDEIQKNIQQQQEILGELYELNQTFVQKNSAGGSAREGAIKGINEALDAYMELVKNLGEATHFYQQFCNLLNTLKVKCERFVADRKGAKIALEARLSQPQQFSSQGQGIPAKYFQQSSNYPQTQQPASYRQAQAPQYQQPPQYSNQPQPQYQQAPQYQQQPQYSNQGSQPQQFIQVQGPDGKPQYIPASSLPNYRPQ
mmetsp:Transcript_65850/g.99285  ORF Transcript_65850/g.99285 Transcript_65850/m.99285 type:complete len:804 (-) Transcript_65850:15-2426(-)